MRLVDTKVKENLFVMAQILKGESSVVFDLAQVQPRNDLLI
jgi:hypothetical protein